MNPLELFHFLQAILRNEAEVIAAFLVGVALTIVAAYMVRRWVFHRHDAQADIAMKDLEIARKEAEIARKDADNINLLKKMEAEQRRSESFSKQLESGNEEHQREKTRLQEKISGLSKQCETLKKGHHNAGTKTDTLQLQLEQTNKEFELYKRKAVHVVTSYKKQVMSLTDQMKQIEQQEGRFWESPVRTTIPPFRPLGVKSAAIVAVTNLKGGVGKTSLTANLGATFWQMGKRVLVVDLDHQASLTFLCLANEQVSDLRQGGGRYLQNVLKAKANHADVAWNNLTRINDRGAYILAASEDLIDVEDHVKAHWLLHPDDFDPRYLLRSALHHPSIQQRFDIILLDCPPRLTTASINALTCSDYALIPALLDRTSTEAVPRLLVLLKRLKEKQVCPNLSILGVLGNRAYPRPKLISRERAVWEDLIEKCKNTWDEPVYHFDRFIPTSAQFAEAATMRVFAAHHANLEPIFIDLVNELQQRKAHHESSRTAAVS